jgi:hypothetical protein
MENIMMKVFMAFFLSIMLIGQSDAGIGDALLGKLDKQKEEVQQAVENLGESIKSFNTAIKHNEVSLITSDEKESLPNAKTACNKGKSGACSATNTKRSPTLKKSCENCHVLIKKAENLMKDLHTEDSEED